MSSPQPKLIDNSALPRLVVERRLTHARHRTHGLFDQAGDDDNHLVSGTVTRIQRDHHAREIHVWKQGDRQLHAGCDTGQCQYGNQEQDRAAVRRRPVCDIHQGASLTTIPSLNS